MKIIAAIGLALSLGACASITRGTSEDVAFQSTPPGAEVRTSNGLACPETPCILKVPRTDQFVATFTKPGYAPRDVQVSTKLSGGGTAGLVGNVLVGGVVGIGIDAYTGASQDHDPNPVLADLRPAGGASRGMARRRPRRERAAAQAPAGAM